METVEIRIDDLLLLIYGYHEAAKLLMDKEAPRLPFYAGVYTAQFLSDKHADIFESYLKNNGHGHILAERSNFFHQRLVHRFHQEGDYE